LLRCKVQTSIG